jgi:putative NIF3 family GTP cyclohydrolase 1 type 2
VRADAGIGENLEERNSNVNFDHPSRRTVIGGALALRAAQRASAQSAGVLTADRVIERIRQNVGVPWRTQTVDNIVLGDGASAVKGIATTMMATLDVVKRCVGAGMNLIISHETPVYMHQDDVQPLAKDPAYLAKKEYIEKNHAVVFHFHDHWHARRPDGIATGMTRELGWEKNLDPENPRRYNFSGTPLAQFAKDMQTKLNARTLRVVGDPKMPVNRVTASWGYMSAVAMAARLEIEVLVVGETREWEVVEYIQDCITAGQKKALIIVGHVLSEQAGMKYCAEWLKTLVTEVPVQFIAAPEPYWSPNNPTA